MLALPLLWSLLILSYSSCRDLILVCCNETKSMMTKWVFILRACSQGYLHADRWPAYPTGCHVAVACCHGNSCVRHTCRCPPHNCVCKSVCECVCVCVWERETQRQRQRERKSLCEFVCGLLLEFYTLATSRVILGWVSFGDSAHSWWLYSASPLGDQSNSTLAWYPA